ncbi:hypothetical protein [Cupriavidus necator]
MTSQINKPVNSTTPTCTSRPTAVHAKPTLSTNQDQVSLGTVEECFRILEKLTQPSVVKPVAAECKAIAAQISDAEEGAHIANVARYVANRLLDHADRSYQEAGVLLLKELSKHGDPYAKLDHARLRWREGPYKNHQYAQKLVDELTDYAWPEWPDEPARIALGHLFRLKGALLIWGEKVRHNPGLGLYTLKFAADKFLDGHAAWLAAQFHAKDPAADFAHTAKPHAKAYSWYMERAREQGVVCVSTRFDGHASTVIDGRLRHRPSPMSAVTGRY